jgi:hypothetical protein
MPTEEKFVESSNQIKGKNWYHYFCVDYHPFLCSIELFDSLTSFQLGFQGFQFCNCFLDSMLYECHEVSTMFLEPPYSWDWHFSTACCMILLVSIGPTTVFLCQ